MKCIAKFAVVVPFWYFTLLYPVQNISGKVPKQPTFYNSVPYADQASCQAAADTFQQQLTHGSISFGCSSDSVSSTPDVTLVNPSTPAE